MTPLDAGYMGTLVSLLFHQSFSAEALKVCYCLFRILFNGYYSHGWPSLMIRAHTGLKTYLSKFCCLCSATLNGTLILYKNIPYMTFMPWILLLLTVDISSFILGILKSVNRSLNNLSIFLYTEGCFSSKICFTCSINILLNINIIMILVPVNGY